MNSHDFNVGRFLTNVVVLLCAFLNSPNCIPPHSNLVKFTVIPFIHSLSMDMNLSIEESSTKEFAIVQNIS